MMFKWYAAVLPLSLLLSACPGTIEPPPPPELRITGLTPTGGATDVSVNSTVEATLELQGKALNLLTLTDSSVVLEDPGGVVAANRSFEAGTLILTPLEALAGETTYTFRTTTDLKTEDGRAVEAFSASFTTEAVAQTGPLTGITGLTMTNGLGAPAADRLVLSRVGKFVGVPCPSNYTTCAPSWSKLKDRRTGTVVLKNTSGAALELNLDSSEPEIYSVTPASVSLANGQSETVKVSVVGDYPEKGLYISYVNARTATQGQSLTVNTLYQTVPEGGHEPRLGTVLKALGYSINQGNHQSNATDSAPAGSEVRSRYWQAASAGSPIEVTQLAAYMTCCTRLSSLVDFEFFAEGTTVGPFFTLAYNTNYAQAVYPAGTGSTNGKVPNKDTIIYNGTFYVEIAGYESLNTGDAGRLGLRFWPVKGQANTYVVGQDFAISPCPADNPDDDDSEGENPVVANCDYQDLLYLVKNIKPVNVSETTP